jgi:NADPH:quinone reductase-like Zn-dependent oxidoreductase
MKAVRILQFGAPDVLRTVETARPIPGNGQVLVRVKGAGVGPWDALIREGKSKAAPQPPLTLGSDLSGVVEEAGAGASQFRAGDEIYGVTNNQFTGAYAEYALASAGKVALKPKSLNFIEAASVPVVAVTAWQMLFEYANAVAGQTVLVLGAAGNVGAYAVQLAKHAGLHVLATAGPRDIEYVRELGAETVENYRSTIPEGFGTAVDAVIDTVGGASRDLALRSLKRGGTLVSVVSQPLPEQAARELGVKAVFFYVDVTTARLQKISELFDNGALVAQVGTVLPLEQARTAHEMLAGAAHNRGKIVLKTAA